MHTVHVMRISLLTPPMIDGSEGIASSIFMLLSFLKKSWQRRLSCHAEAVAKAKTMEGAERQVWHSSCRESLQPLETSPSRPLPRCRQIIRTRIFMMPRFPRDVRNSLKAHDDSPDVTSYNVLIHNHNYILYTYITYHYSHWHVYIYNMYIVI
jgi:hypothetical protein